MTIGERLEEARKRKGISIREVSEATKIRSDFINAMEDNSMEIPLPEIYKRGFLKNYARYLKLDPEKMLTDYVAQQKGRAGLQRERPSSAHEDREVFGRMELDEEPDTPVPGGAPEREEESDEGDAIARPKDLSNPGGMGLTDNTLYLKIAFGLMAVMVLVLLVVVILKALTGSQEVNLAETPATGPATTTVRPGPTSPSTDPAALPPTSGPSTIILRATSDVTVIVDDVVTRERLFSGILRAGETQLIEREGVVKIKYSKGSALEVEMPDGQIVRPSTPPEMSQIQL